MPKNNKLGCSYSTQLKLAKSLKELMAHQPFEKLSVSDITNNCSLHRQTFYYHFEDKYELLDSLIVDLEKGLVKKLEENSSSTSAKSYYMKMIELFFDHISENINVYAAIIKKNNNSIVMDMAYDAIIKDVESHIDEYENIKTDIPTQIISKFYVSAVINVCLEYIKYPNKYKKEDILSYLNSLLPDKIY